MSSRKVPAGKSPPRKSASQKIDAGAAIRHWLFKSEPEVFSWEMLKTRGTAGEPWDGVRNYQARNNMRAMRLGDLGFFYHSGESREIVGIMEVSALAHPDPKDGAWECVDVRAVRDVPHPVPLAVIKDNRKLARMMLVVNSRLSVQPVTDAEWDEVCRMGGLDAKTRKAKKRKG
jgi:predicted RNA-binding protein with PUA-like domain